MPTPTGPLVYEGNVPVFFVPAIADIENPTVTEIEAGDDLSSYIRKDGVQFPSTRNMVDTSSLDSDFDSEYPGSSGGALVINFKRQNRDGDADAWDTFKGGLVSGFFVFGFEGSADQENDEVDIYQVVTHKVVRANPAPNTEQTFVVNCGVQDERIGVTVVDDS